MRLIRKPFKGTHYYEFQILGWYFQLRRKDNKYKNHHRLIAVRYDPYWKR